MRILITGGKGFVGKHLGAFLNQEHTVFTYDLRDSQDIRNYEKVRQAIDICRPDRIYHLAALTYVPESFDDPVRTFDINVKGTINLLEAVRRSGFKTKVLIASTSEDAGTLSPYGISKSTAQLLGESYAKRYDMPIVVTRTYSHTGPGKGEEMAESAFAKQIAEIEKGRREKLIHGNLDAIRNFTDVRDVIRAYRLAIELPSGTYDICSDTNVSMYDVLETLKFFSEAEIKTELDNRFTRPSPKKPKPNYDKFHKLTGWKPEVDFETTMEDLLNYWRNYENNINL